MSQDEQLDGAVRSRRSALRTACGSSATGSRRTTAGSRRRARGCWPTRRRSSTPSSPRSCGGSGCCRSTTRWRAPSTPRRVACARSRELERRSRPRAARAARRARRWRRTSRSSSELLEAVEKNDASREALDGRARFARVAAPAPAAEVGRGDRRRRLLGRDRRRAGAGGGRPRQRSRRWNACSARCRTELRERSRTPTAPAGPLERRGRRRRRTRRRDTAAPRCREQPEVDRCRRHVRQPSSTPCRGWAADAGAGGARQAGEHLRAARRDRPTWCRCARRRGSLPACSTSS